jgi:hypothetical protein
MTEAKKGGAPKGSAATNETDTGGGDNTTERSIAFVGAGNLDNSGPADASAVTGATSPSGALQEDEALTPEMLEHPAVDNNPRANTTQNMNRADFNDPAQKDQDAVIDKLGLEPLSEEDRPEPLQRTMRVEDGTRRSRSRD